MERDYIYSTMDDALPWRHRAAWLFKADVHIVSVRAHMSVAQTGILTVSVEISFKI